MNNLVVIESPYKHSVADEFVKNLVYARACLKDSLDRGEISFASHLLYTQHGVLNDAIVEERNIGIGRNLAMIERCDIVAVYIDRGISTGMLTAIWEAQKLNKEISFRTIKFDEHNQLS